MVCTWSRLTFLALHRGLVERSRLHAAYELSCKCSWVSEQRHSRAYAVVPEAPGSKRPRNGVKRLRDNHNMEDNIL